MKLELREMNLKPIGKVILVGGTKQCKINALFVALLPDDDSYYTASEVVQAHIDKDDFYDFYVEQRTRLDGLARKKGLALGNDPGPDNIDPITKDMLPGKSPGTKQPYRWGRTNWFLTIQDETYQWLYELDQKVIALRKDSPDQTRFFFDLDSFEITMMPPAVVMAPSKRFLLKSKLGKWFTALAIYRSHVALALLILIAAVGITWKGISLQKADYSNWSTQSYLDQRFIEKEPHFVNPMTKGELKSNWNQGDAKGTDSPPPLNLMSFL